jgi:hypothetical protein
MFDPWIPTFTWDVVREYMKKGADPEHPILAPEPSEEEKRMRELELRATIAAAELVRAEAGVTATGNGNGSGGGASPQEGKCPVCSANASPSSDKGHAPWCKARDDGIRHDSRRAA